MNILKKFKTRTSIPICSAFGSLFLSLLIFLLYCGSTQLIIFSKDISVFPWFCLASIITVINAYIGWLAGTRMEEYLLDLNINDNIWDRIKYGMIIGIIIHSSIVFINLSNETPVIISLLMTFAPLILFSVGFFLDKFFDKNNNYIKYNNPYSFGMGIGITHGFITFGFMGLIMIPLGAFIGSILGSLFGIFNGLIIGFFLKQNKSFYMENYTDIIKNYEDFS